MTGTSATATFPTQWLSPIDSPFVCGRGIYQKAITSSHLHCDSLQTAPKRAPASRHARIDLGTVKRTRDPVDSMRELAGKALLHDIRPVKVHFPSTSLVLEADSLGTRTLGCPGNPFGRRRETQAVRMAPPRVRPEDAPRYFAHPPRRMGDQGGLRAVCARCVCSLRVGEAG